jgi:hypothetical protein
MSSIIAKAFAEAKQDFKQFWDETVLPFERKEVKVIEFTLENVQKELEPIEETALKAIAGAGVAAAAAASGGVIPTSIEAAVPILVAGAKAALSEAALQGKPLTHQAAIALVAAANVPLPVVPNGANG